MSKYNLIKILWCFKVVLAYTLYSRLKKNIFDTVAKKHTVFICFLNENENNAKIIIPSYIENHVAIAVSVHVIRYFL